MNTHFLYIIEILGTIAFALSGAFMAMEKKLDPFGVIILAFVTAIGGGTIRDVLIGNTPVAWLRNETITIVILLTAGAAFFFGKHLRQLTTTLFIFDSLGLGLFTVIGIEKGLELHFSPGICVALGTMTGCFGGVLRDVLLNNVPLIFHKEIYASACMIGGGVYFLLVQTTLSPDWITIISIIVIVVIRVVAVKYKLALPAFYK